MKDAHWVTPDKLLAHYYESICYICYILLNILYELQVYHRCSRNKILMQLLSYIFYSNGYINLIFTVWTTTTGLVKRWKALRYLV
jgi:hypothetical protein